MHKTIAKMFVNSEPVKDFKISPGAFSLNVFFSLSCTFSLPLIQQMLSRLLNSSHPEDLRAANKLIKEMVQEVSRCVCICLRYFSNSEVLSS